MDKKINTNLNGVSSQNSEEINTESIFTPKSDKDLIREKKDRKRELVISAIGDGISSLSNLFFTTKGAPSQIQTTGKNAYKPMTSRLQEKFKLEDQEYQNAFVNWQKVKEKEQKDNQQFKLNDNYSLNKNNWGDTDYVNELFEYMIDINKDENLSNTIDKFRYSYEPINVWDGEKWIYTGKNKTIDRFKGKSGTYLKRDLIEMLFNDGLTDEVNLKQIGDSFLDFDKNWVKLK